MRIARTETATAATTLETSGFFALRTPLLPFAELSGWSEGLGAPAAGDAAALAIALDADRRQLRARLRAVIARPEVREAIFVASPSLDDSLPAWLADPESDRGQKTERALVRYFTRMCTRATPFGLFAGSSSGTVAADTHLHLGPLGDYRRHTRLDGDYLARLTAALGHDPAVRAALSYRPSSALYRAAGRLHYVVSQTRNAERSFDLVALEPSDYLEATLARAAGGARLDALAEALVEGEVSRAEAEEFIATLVESQVLVSELEPPVTGPEPIHDLIAQLESLPGTPAAGALDAVRRALVVLDDSPLGAAPERYLAVREALETLPVAVEPRWLFQVDLTKPAPQMTLGSAVVAEIGDAVAWMHRVFARPQSALSQFRESFERRYELREVPLMEALDVEAGIGFDQTAEASPLLEGLPFAVALHGGGAAAAPGEALLLRKLAAALASGAQEITLDREEHKPFEDAGRPPLPGSVAVLATIAATSEAALAAGDYLVSVQGVIGPSGANLLGRFCHADPALTAHVNRHLRAEQAQRPEAIFAEIVHLPQGRIGNVLLRPVLRDYEISYLGRSGAPPDQQIRVDDLRLSLRDGRLVLRSQRLGREIVPRLSTAHNHAAPQNLALYRFLCALQNQDVAMPGFDWGATLEQLTFLPRVRVGKLVLALARWSLGKRDLEPLGKARTAAGRYLAAQALRRAHRMPRWVALTDGDHVLPLDLDNSLAVDTLVQLVAKRPIAILTELFEPERLCAVGAEGHFMHELVLPLVCTPPVARAEHDRPIAVPRAVRARPPAPPARRTRLPGSDWLYVKLYAGPATADLVLSQVVAPVVASAMQTGAADAWFFIRYGDPDWHLRLRLHGDPARLRNEVLPDLAAAAGQAMERQQLWRLQLDTYEREVERYGGDACMELAEQVFWADSEAALAILATLQGDEGADARWRLTLRGMDMLLEDLGFDLDGRLALARSCRASYGRELAAGEAMARLLGERFRRERLALEALLTRAADHESPYSPGLSAFAERSARLRPLAARLRALLQASEPSVTLEDLASSLLHMHANRVLRSSARSHELVLYDFLVRLYEGQVARRKRPSSRVVA
jgi:lantibiotic biosynthesis protein